MRFSSLPNERDDSHLFVTVSNGCLSCMLLSVDYENARSKTEQQDIALPSDFRLDDLDGLLRDLLLPWEKEIGWDLIKCADDVCSDALAEGSDGETVDGTSLLVSQEYFKAGYRSLVLGVDAVELDDKLTVDSAARFLEVVGGSDMVYVVLNWDVVRVLLLNKGGNVSSPQDQNIHVNEFVLEGAGNMGRGLGTSADTEVEPGVSSGVKPDPRSKNWLRNASFWGSQMGSLMSVSIPQRELEDRFRDLFQKRVVDANSSGILDILRAYITSLLFSLQGKGFRRFGMDTPDGHLMITGDLARIVPEKHLILAVIDGLQLRGRYNISVDMGNRAFPGGAALVNRNFICPINSIYPHRYIYLSTEKGGSGRSGTQAFRGKIVKVGPPVGENEDLIVGQSGHLQAFRLSGMGKIKIQPDKAAFFPNLKREKNAEGDFLTHEYSEEYDALIVDCREIPVVYGPDVNSNHKRMSEWVNGLGIISDFVE